MRVLVTGATGGLGRNAVEALLARGVVVRATGRNRETGAEIARTGAHFVALDLALASAAELAALLTGVDAVWHCAALSSPWGAKAAFVAANVEATARLVEAAGKAGVARFVHISTPAIYFDYRHRADVNETFRPRRYVNHYAATKARAEQCVQEAVARYPAMLCVILRPRAIFGPYDQVLVPRLQRMLDLRGGRLPLPRGGKVTIDMTYVENVVYAMWLASHNRVQSGMTFNITNHQPAELGEVLQSLFADRLQRPFQIARVPYWLLALAARAMQLRAAITGREPALTPYSVGAISYNVTLDNMKAKYLLGYQPMITLEEGVRRTALWLRRHG